MVAKQLSIFLDNKSGRPTEVTEALPRTPILVFSAELYPIRIRLTKL